MATTIKVLTLNMWGVPFASKKIKERSEHLIERLLDSDYQIVGLQEVFLEWHAKFIQEGVQSIFGHSHWFRSGALGSPGLLVLSRYPIIEVGFCPFSLNGYPQHIHRGDWWAGKGVGLCRIDHPLSTIDFYSTHLHANYAHVGYDMYTGHRIHQMFCMAKYIDQSSRSNAVLAVGDFNSKEDEIATEVFMEASDLTDSYRELHPDKINDPGYTNDTPECSWRSTAETAKMCSNGTVKRIDYVFYNKNKLNCTNSEVTMGKIPGQEYSYSDHMGVSCTFELNTAEPGDVIERIFSLTKFTAEAALQSLEVSLKQAHADTKQKLIFWLIIMLLWAGVIAVGALNLLPAVIVGVVASTLAALATAIFWYLVIFTRGEVSKFREARNEMSVIARFSQ